jgi:hypothetical protein
MKFLVPNYSCLQNRRLGDYRPQIPVRSVLCPQLNLLNPPPNKLPGYATDILQLLCNSIYFSVGGFGTYQRDQVLNYLTLTCVLSELFSYGYSINRRGLFIRLFSGMWHRVVRQFTDVSKDTAASIIYTGHGGKWIYKTLLPDYTVSQPRRYQSLSPPEPRITAIRCLQLYVFASVTRTYTLIYSFISSLINLNEYSPS